MSEHSDYMAEMQEQAEKHRLQEPERALAAEAERDEAERRNDLMAQQAIVRQKRERALREALERIEAEARSIHPRPSPALILGIAVQALAAATPERER